MDGLIGFFNQVMWGYVLVYGLMAAGVFFTLRFGFLQIFQFPEMWRSLMRGKSTGGEGISPFQALCTSLASRVGTGNITGVAIAVVSGGPGAVFWMWLVAFLGMATSFAECTLAQLYKTRERGDSGMTFRGGPAFYISRGLGLPWLGIIFALCVVMALGLVINALQSSAISDAMEGAFGVSRGTSGLALAVLTALVVFGGIRKVAQVAEYVVPFMAGAYFLVTLYVIGTHISDIPQIFAEIFYSAFGYGEMVGGLSGSLVAAMLNGVKRGLFSNEAGMGSAPHIAAAANPVPHHPASQGFVQAFAVFIDTILVCSCTAMIILLSDAYIPNGALTGTQLTQVALSEHIGSFGGPFVAIALFFFAFTTIVGCYTYAEMAMAYLGWTKKLALFALRSGAVLMVLWGSGQTIQSIFALADAAIALMALINVTALVLLSGKVTTLVRDYKAQRRAGKEPYFSLADHPDLAKGLDQEVWR